jgi:hypothetical protein
MATWQNNPQAGGNVTYTNAERKAMGKKWANRAYGTQDPTGKTRIPYSQRGAVDAAHERDTKGCAAVDSSAIAQIGYNDKDSRMVVTFNSGKSYAYFQVSRQRYQAFCDAGSKGRYFNANVRDAYSFRRLG